MEIFYEPKKDKIMKYTPFVKRKKKKKQRLWSKSQKIQ